MGVFIFVCITEDGARPRFESGECLTDVLHFFFWYPSGHDVPLKADDLNVTAKCYLILGLRPRRLKRAEGSAGQHPIILLDSATFANNDSNLIHNYFPS